MKAPCPVDDEPRSREAAAWLVRRDRGFTAAEQDEFSRWLALDPRHGEWFARHRQTWQDFNLLVQWKPEHSAEPNPDLLARGRAAARWLPLGALGLAACLALALARDLASKPVASPEPRPLAYAVAPAYERHVLADGTLVKLNRGARIEVLYDAAERRVRLVQGEAHFTVAKNPARPFIVRAAGVDVKAVGTVFNVRLGDQRVEVLVTEGRVRVDGAAQGGSLLAASVAGETPLLSAGQRVVVDAAPVAPAPVAAERVSPEEISRLLAWQPPVLDFDSTPLAGVVDAFNARNQTRLIIADPALRTLPIVASFHADNVEGFVRLLELTAGVRVERTGGAIVLHGAR